MDYKEKFGAEEMDSGIGKIMDSMKSAGLREPVFKEEIGGFSVYFRKDIYTEESLRKLGLNERQIKAVMYVEGKGKITNKEYQKITQTINRTALRDLIHLCETSVLKQISITERKSEYILIRQKPTRGQKRASKEQESKIYKRNI